MTANSGVPGSELTQRLEREAGSAYLLSFGLRVLWVNEGWRRFARENGAPELATAFEARGALLEIMAEPLRSFYRAAFARVASSGEPWSHLYECSSADVFRKLCMQVSLTPERDAFVVVHSTVVEMALGAVGSVDVGAYENHDGLVIQCANCRRVRRASAEGAWDWVPALVRFPADNVSHGLCSTCDFLYYSELN